ncbi:MAG TPA: sigma-54 dependent transcriptional regulator [Terriglobia bacterium]|nr:sigma-54 dependent transcriptional regulator [Terriglobia bacterium]
MDSAQGVRNQITAPVWVGDDPASESIRKFAFKLAGTSSTLLIVGESGTGKELLAAVIHYLGPNCAEPLLKIDCATLPEALIESELFGHEKGAFTGASSAKAGRLELAGQGTVVLDEVAALTLGMQAKLLRVVDQRTFERLGGTMTQRMEARLMALTSTDLGRGVEEGSFREDLYFRLSVIPVTIPPLRDRRGDIRPLAEHFLDRLATLHRSSVRGFASEALRAIETYDFPGNVRELRNTIERALVQAQKDKIEREHLPASITQSDVGAGARRATLAEVESEHIRQILKLTRGRKSEAAAILGISRKTLLEKRKRYHLD